MHRSSHPNFWRDVNILCRIEVCLNSRSLPFSIISTIITLWQSFSDRTSLITPVEPSILDLNEHRLSRSTNNRRFLEVLVRWLLAYPSTTPKIAHCPVAKVGQIVLVRNPLVPSSQWELDRITACYPGDDELTRVITIKSTNDQL